MADDCTIASAVISIDDIMVDGQSIWNDSSQVYDSQIFANDTHHTFKVFVSGRITCNAVQGGGTCSACIYVYMISDPRHGGSRKAVNLNWVTSACGNFQTFTADTGLQSFKVGNSIIADDVVQANNTTLYTGIGGYLAKRNNGGTCDIDPGQGAGLPACAVGFNISFI